jgi:hypothetical protein
MNLYAVALSDLDLAWKTTAGSAILESALDSEAKPETVMAEPGVEACVLGVAEEIAESIASGLLCFDLPLSEPRRARVYARSKGERKWTRLRHPTDVPYASAESPDVGSPRVDPEFFELSAPMDDATRAALRASLVAEGCRDALVVWAEKDILLDGHHRLAICRETGIAFEVKRLSFPDRASAMEWFIAAQRTRRSLTPHWAMYYLGRQYNAAKQTGFKVRSGQSDRNETSARIAAVAGVGEKTVRRAAAFAEAIDTLEAAVPHARRAVLNREVRLSRQQIERAVEGGVRTLRELREMAEPEERDYLAEVLRGARKLRDAIEALRVHGVGEDDRARVAGLAHAERSVLFELPLLLDLVRADVGLADEVAEADAEGALAHG